MFVQQIVSGLAIGSIYALVAIGYTLIWRALGVLNFSQGDLLMLGAYIGYQYNVLMNVNYMAAIVLTILTSAMVGLVYSGVLERVRGRKNRQHGCYHWFVHNHPQLVQNYLGRRASGNSQYF